MPNEFEIMNEYGSNRIPFFFLISYDKKDVQVIKISELNSNGISFANNYFSEICEKQYRFDFKPIDFHEYKKKFQKVMSYLENGDSYLLNLTCCTEISTDLTLEDIYRYSKSQFKLLYKDNFVCFSPEKFIGISNNKIYTNPMKGTIKAGIPNAEQELMNDKKEIAEHYTIVDLLRNDLSMVAKKVRVEKFRYIDKINTNQGKILQTSSLIAGQLEHNWHSNIGTILDKITPAGSVTGAPKYRTCQIIDEVEGFKRGFYTGIAGIYDAVSLSSYVLIRFIENIQGKLFFKSGGGITTQSKLENEYAELINKIYVPIIRNH